MASREDRLGLCTSLKRVLGLTVEWVPFLIAVPDPTHGSIKVSRTDVSNPGRSKTAIRA